MALVVEDLLAAFIPHVFMYAINASMCAGFNHLSNLVVEDLQLALDDPACEPHALTGPLNVVQVSTTQSPWWWRTCWRRWTT